MRYGLACCFCRAMVSYCAIISEWRVDSLRYVFNRSVINPEEPSTQNLGSFFSFAAVVISIAMVTSLELEILSKSRDSHCESLMNILLPTALKANSTIGTNSSHFDHSSCA